jgi:hypothetical protein
LEGVAAEANRTGRGLSGARPRCDPAAGDRLSRGRAIDEAALTALIRAAVALNRAKSAG